VQRRQLGRCFELAHDSVVDHHRLAKSNAAVDDAVRDGRDAGRNGTERLELRGSAVRLDNRELQARGARIDD